MAVDHQFTRWEFSSRSQARDAKADIAISTSSQNRVHLTERRRIRIVTACDPIRLRRSPRSPEIPLTVRPPVASKPEFRGPACGIARLALYAPQEFLRSPRLAPLPAPLSA